MLSRTAMGFAQERISGLSIIRERGVSNDFLRDISDAILELKMHRVIFPFLSR